MFQFLILRSISKILPTEILGISMKTKTVKIFFLFILFSKAELFTVRTYLYDEINFELIIKL